MYEDVLTTTTTTTTTTNLVSLVPYMDISLDGFVHDKKRSPKNQKYIGSCVFRLPEVLGWSHL